MTSVAPSVASTGGRRQLESIQVLRGLGMGLILIGHIALAVVYGDETLTRLVPQAVIVFLANAADGMLDIFFVGSGFIMVYISRATFGERGAWRKFAWMRITKVVPVYWVCVTLAIAMGAIVGDVAGFQQPGWEGALKSYLFIPYAHGEVTGIFGETRPWVRPVLPAGWTLNYEMYFYLLFALAMLVRMRTGLLLMTGWAVATGLLHALVPQDAIALSFWTSATLWKFVAGAWIGVLYWTGWRYMGPKAVVLLAGVLAFAAHWCVYGMFLQRPDSVIFHALSAFAASVMIGAAVLTRFETLERSPRALVALGDASYSIYLTHIFVYVPVFGLLGMAFDMTLGQRVIAGAGCFAMAIGLGFAVYRWVELPLIRWSRGFMRRG